MLLKTIPVEDIKNYLLLGKDGIDKVFKMTFENMANNNFYFQNSNKKNISYLIPNDTINEIDFWLDNFIKGNKENKNKER